MNRKLLKIAVIKALHTHLEKEAEKSKGVSQGLLTAIKKIKKSPSSRIRPGSDFTKDQFRNAAALVRKGRENKLRTLGILKP